MSIKTGTSLSRTLSHTFKVVPSAAAIAAFFALGGSALSQEAPGKDEVFTATTVVSGFGSQKILTFDISFVDPDLGRYYLADRTNAAIDVTITSSNSLEKQIGLGQFVGFTGNNDTSGPNGVLTVNDNEVWAGNGPQHPTATTTVTNLLVFPTTANDSTLPSHTINTGGLFRVDEGCFDKADQLVVFANDAEHDAGPTTWPFISFIATGKYPIASKQYTALGKITMDGTSGTPKATNGIEQCQWSPKTGKIYLNIPEVNGPGDDSVAGAVLVIDPKTETIEHTWTINHDDCAGPQGMALGPSNQILLGCNAASGNGKFSTVIINLNSGAITRVLDNESGADEVWFNPNDGHFFLARSSAVDTAGDQLLGVVDSSGKREDMSVTTQLVGKGNAHSVAADPNTNQVYVPIPGNTVTAGVCSAAGGSDTDGCIAVFTTKHDDRSKMARERGQDDNQQ